MNLKPIALFFTLLMIFCCAEKEKEDIYLADPTIMYFDGYYYLYGTEKKPQQGIPVLRSKDLKAWEIPPASLDGYALKVNESTYGEWGFWAPQVIERNGEFYMLYTANENIAIAKSASPEGLFTQQEIIPLKAEKRQIDPFLFFDDDGKAYLYHVRLHEGNTIWVGEFEPDLSGVIDSTLTQCIVPTAPWEDTQQFKSAIVIEGPTVIKRGDMYYLFYSANHFQNIDYAVGYAVSKSPYGPWEKPAHNPIINRHLVGEYGSGHGDIFEDKAGNLKYVFHTHYDKENVNPRKTYMVDLVFTPDPETGTEIVTIDPGSLFSPYMAK